MSRDEKPKPNAHLGLVTVLAAAIVNQEFCTLLLHDPKMALRKGYQGEPFALSAEETELFLSTSVDSLQNLAKTILAFKPKEKPLLR